MVIVLKFVFVFEFVFVKCVLLFVYDKIGLVDFVKGLVDCGVELVLIGGFY